MAKELMHQIDEQCFEGFSEQERRQTIEYLNRIYENLKGKENLNHNQVIKVVKRFYDY